MNKKIVTCLFSCLLIAINVAQGMAPAAPEIHVDPAEEKLLVVEVESNTLSWDEISAMVRPEFKAMLEGECRKQELAAACKALQRPTDPEQAAYLAFISYVQLNGVTSAARPYSSIDHNFEQALHGHLIVAKMCKSKDFVAAVDRVNDYKKSRRHVWLERLNLIQCAVSAPLIIFSFVYGFQNKQTCMF